MTRRSAADPADRGAPRLPVGSELAWPPALSLDGYAVDCAAFCGTIDSIQSQRPGTSRPRSRKRRGSLNVW